MFSVPRFIKPKPSTDGTSQRRIVFIDTSLQGRLLAALILLETSMLIAALIYLYLKFNGIIEANLFTIHFSSRADLLPQFFEQMIRVILIMSLTNTVALMVAHHLWGSQIKSTMSAFVHRLRRFQALNFRRHDAEKQPHKVLVLLHQWQQLEIDRMNQFKSRIKELADFDSASDDPQALRLQLQQCKELLQLKPLSKSRQDCMER
ncbi:MAG: hypothetical protein V7677_02680 [Motiliproteus sp.]